MLNVAILKMRKIHKKNALIICIFLIIGQIWSIELLDNLSNDTDYLLEIDTKANGVAQAKQKCANNNAVLAPIHDSFDRSKFTERVEKYSGRYK